MYQIQPGGALRGEHAPLKETSGHKGPEVGTRSENKNSDLCPKGSNSPGESLSEWSYSRCSINVPCISGTHQCLGSSGCPTWGSPGVSVGPQWARQRFGPPEIRVCACHGERSPCAWRSVFPVTRTPIQASLKSCGDKTRSLIPFLLKKRIKKILAGNF